MIRCRQADLAINVVHNGRVGDGRPVAGSEIGVLAKAKAGFVGGPGR